MSLFQLQVWRNATTPSRASAYETFDFDDTTGGNMGIGRLTSEGFTGGPQNSLSGSYSYAYDSRGQETSATLTIAGASSPYKVQTYYDDAGNQTFQIYPNGEGVTTLYSDHGWLNGVTAGSATLMNNVSYAGQYGGAGQLITGASLGGGSGTYQYSATYDALLRATDRKITNYNGSTTLFDQARAFDFAGNVATTSTTLAQGTDNQVFCYDEQDRLTWAGSTGTPPCTGTAISPGTLTAAQYTDWRSYDAMGRLTARPNSFGGGGQDTYVYGDPAHVHAVTTINGLLQANSMPAYSAIYDAAGNMTCRDTGGGLSGAGKCIGGSNGAQLTYDAEGSLVAWKNAPTNATTTMGFLYDGHGNRVEQQITQSGTTTTTIYVGNLEEISTTGSTTTTTNYYYAGSARIAMNANGVISYLGTDGLGSTNVALDASGNPTASSLYMPYGWVRYSSGTLPTTYGFTGERADGATQLDYFNARYYDPVAGQFTTADTVLPGGGYDIFGLSRYAYVEGNPTTRTDPTGRCPWCIGALVGGVVGGAISYGTQVVGNLQHGQSLGSALTHVDVGEIGKAALVGAVIGATGGLATAGLGAVGLGGVAAGVGGRIVMGGVEGGAAQIGDNLLHGRSWSDGVGDATLIGAATGGLSPLGGAALRQVTKRFGREAVADGPKAMKGSACGCNACGMSFSADTTVATPDGPRAIASIKVGDSVLAYDPGTVAVTSEAVEQVFVNHDSDRLDVTLDMPTASASQGLGAGPTLSVGSGAIGRSTETIHTTASHPWLTADRGWVDASALLAGEPVQLANGSIAEVDRLQRVPGVGTMYDLRLEQVHTFTVGIGLYVVHNCGESLTVFDPAFAARQQPRDHHIFPNQFKAWFKMRNIENDNYVVTLDEMTHLRGVHGRGIRGLPGRWNARWRSFIEDNPEASAKDIYQFAGQLMDDFGLSGTPIHGYRLE